MNKWIEAETSNGPVRVLGGENFLSRENYKYKKNEGMELGAENLTRGRQMDRNEVTKVGRGQLVQTLKP